MFTASHRTGYVLCRREGGVSERGYYKGLADLRGHAPPSPTVAKRGEILLISPSCAPSCTMVLVSPDNVPENEKEGCVRALHDGLRASCQRVRISFERGCWWTPNVDKQGARWANLCCWQ